MPPQPPRKAKSPKPDFVIRRGTVADLEVLAEQRNSMYRDMFPDSTLDFPGYKRRYISWARAMMKRRRLITFVATDRKGKPVAGGTLWMRENHPSLRYAGTVVPYLMSMYTDPSYRRRGLATMIVEEAVEWSRKHGYPRITLHASKMGEPVYARLGFERSSEMRMNLEDSRAHASRPLAPRRR